MKYTAYKDLELSQLTLGTVQFGLNYGIANRTGRPSYESARDIIACAYEGGVNCLDTAAAYGESEDVLGRALSELGIKDKVHIVSKVPPMPESLTAKEADDFIEKSIEESLKRLGIDMLPICLLHREENSCYLESLAKLKDKGLIRHVGVSVMTPEATRTIVESGLAEAVQIPTNILDRRFTGTGTTRMMKDQVVGVFVRSVYLQGLILMPEAEIPENLSVVAPVLARLRRLAEDAGMNLAELAMRYVLGIEGLTSVLVGVDTVEQMQQNLSLFEHGALGVELMQAVDDIVPVLDDCVLMPNKWKRTT